MTPFMVKVLVTLDDGEKPANAPRLHALWIATR
jgi:hypothetical protein